MTRFNPSSHYQRSPEEWSALAFQKTTENNIQWNIAGGLVAAAIATSAASPLVGGAIVIWTIANAIGKAKEIQRNQAAIREYGCVAHVLEGDDFKAYLQQAGEDAVKAELNFAADNGYVISNSALDYVEDKAPELPAFQRAIAPANGAITNFVDFTKPVPDLTKKLAEDLKNSLIVGVPGSGKAVFVTNALQAIASMRPEVKVFYIDPKNDEKETGYFEGRTYRCYRKYIDDMSPDATYEWIQECLNDYDSCDAGNGYKLLVFDELANVAGKLDQVRGALKWLKGKLTGYSSSGSSRGIIVWAISQNAHCQNVGINGGTRSIFTPIFLIWKNNIPASQALLDTSMVPSDKKLSSSQIAEVCDRSPIGRAIFHGGLNEWFSVPEMPVYSGYNRDKREQIGDALAAQARDQIRAVSATQLKASDVMIQKLEATEAQTIEEFISKDLRSPSKIEELKQAIANTLQQANRQDLIRKFF